MAKDFITSGFLDVKISAKVKRGLTPWKAWKKQWCEIKRLDTIDNGLEIRLKNSVDSNSANYFIIPRNAILCRTESRSKQFSFGVFGPGRCYKHKPLLFLSGLSESDCQLWMYSIRRMLSFATHISAHREGYYVSLIDNAHSRAASLNGTHGVLTTDAYEITIKDPYTNEIRIRLKWYQLLQFHLAATNSLDDEGKICVIHTSKEFRAGAGQLYFYCPEAPQLLELLVTRGKLPRIYVNAAVVNRRFSRSEGDLRDSDNSVSCITDSPSSPVHLRSQSGSEDSGVRVSMASDDSSLVVKCKKAASLLSIGLGMLVATPGGSEVDNESMNELLENDEVSIQSSSVQTSRNSFDIRRESGVSLVSGVYEEIPDFPTPPKEFCNDEHIVHHYEDPIDIILGTPQRPGHSCKPPPLPPRQDNLRKDSFSDEGVDLATLSPPPSPRNRRKISIIIGGDSEYMIMTPSKVETSETIYTPMSGKNITSAMEENGYMIMNGKKSK